MRGREGAAVMEVKAGHDKLWDDITCLAGRLWMAY